MKKYLLMLFLVMLASFGTAAPLKMETGTISMNGEIDDYSGAYRTVSTKYSYSNPVVVAYIETFNGNQPIEVRVRNVKSDSFEIFFDEPGSSGHVMEDVAYIVMEEGVYSFPDGTKIEAGTVETDLVHREGEQYGGKLVNFQQDFQKPPAVLATLDTYNNKDFMSTVVTGLKETCIDAGCRPTKDYFMVQQEAAGSDSSAAMETIGWIAMEHGVTGSIKGGKFETGLVNDGTADGVDDGGHTVSYTQSFSSTPLVVAKGQSGTGTDGYWTRGGGIHNSDQHNMIAEEDTEKDAEQNHGNVFFGYAAFDPGFSINITPPVTKVNYSATDWKNTSQAVKVECVNFPDCNKVEWRINKSDSILRGPTTATQYDVVAVGSSNEGELVLEYRGITPSGYKESPWNTKTVKIDKTSPTTDMTLTGSGPYTDNFTVNVDDSDSLSGIGSGPCSYRVKDDGVWTGWKSRSACPDGSFEVSVGKPGTGWDCTANGVDTCEVQVRVFDKAGNVAYDTESFQINVVTTTKDYSFDTRVDRDDYTAVIITSEHTDLLPVEVENTGSADQTFATEIVKGDGVEFQDGGKKKTYNLKAGRTKRFLLTVETSSKGAHDLEIVTTSQDLGIKSSDQVEIHVTGHELNYNREVSGLKNLQLLALGLASIVAYSLLL